MDLEELRYGQKITSNHVKWNISLKHCGTIILRNTIAPKLS